MIDILIGAGVAVVFLLIIARGINKKKKGETAGCGCGGSSNCCSSTGCSHNKE